MKILRNTALLIPLIFSSLSFAGVAVVVNTGNGAVVSEKEISRIFLGKLKKFDGGESVKVVNSKRKC